MMCTSRPCTDHSCNIWWKSNWCQRSCADKVKYWNIHQVKGSNSARQLLNWNIMMMCTSRPWTDHSCNIWWKSNWCQRSCVDKVKYWNIHQVKGSNSARTLLKWNIMMMWKSRLGTDNSCNIWWKSNWCQRSCDDKVKYWKIHQVKGSNSARQLLKWNIIMMCTSRPAPISAVTFDENPTDVRGVM